MKVVREGNEAIGEAMNTLVSTLSAQYRSEQPECRTAENTELTGLTSRHLSVLQQSRRPRCAGRAENLFQLFGFAALLAILWSDASA